MIRWMFLGGLIVVGCADMDGVPAPASDEGETLTVVHLHGADAPEVSTFSAGASRMNHGVVSASQSASQDAACSGASLWLYAAANRTGSRVCFTGNGYASLADLCLRSTTLCTGGICRSVCLQSWSGAVRSYWSGSASSTLLQRYSGTPATSAPTCTEYALAYRQENTALACAQSATHVWLGSDLPHEVFGYSTPVPASDPNPADVRVDVGGLASATASVTGSSGTTATTSGSLAVTLTATADNPGGVRSLTVTMSAAASCHTTSGEILGRTTTTDFVPLSSSDALAIGALTSTRRSTVRSLTLVPGPCPAGWAIDGTSYIFTATATTYGGVTTTTPIASVRVTP